jgi:starch synthase (maltosyl-transferring)
MDVYVQPSLYEGMPNALMEAMAAGRPIVATAVDGINELVIPGETGWLVPPAEPRPLAMAILHALTDTETASRAGCAAARRMAQGFSIEGMVDAYDEMYRGLVEEARA